MLAELRITNFALIEHLELEFGAGFNVLTGETGAGKSIIVGAINLILGERASSDSIRQGQEEAEVQALFTHSDMTPVNAVLAELGLPEGDEVLVRRVLPKTGRNRIYINGALATLAQLSAIGRELVAVSGQHEHQQLLDSDRQLLLLDQFGGLLPLRTEMGRLQTEVSILSGQKAELERKIKEAREKSDLYDFQVKEIEAADLRIGEDVELEAERNLVRHAEKIFRLVKGGYDRLYGESGAVVESLGLVISDLQQAAVLDARLSPTQSQIQDAFHQLDDAANFLRDHLEQFVFEPSRLEEIEERLALIHRMKRKYGGTLEQVLDHGRNASHNLEAVAEMERRLVVLTREATEAEAATLSMADELSDQRRRVSGNMSELVAEQLRSLGMPKLEFEISFRSRPSGVRPGPVGWDEIDFMISPNVGEALRPLSRIASGGELSRAMLGLKSLMAGQDRVQTVIFDEVDAGIGGAVAEVVGRKIKDLSGFHQMLCITHLPQIAVFGQNHLRVFKEVRGDRTLTDIKLLTAEDRVDEIARMLGGVEPTEKTRAAAMEMLSRAAQA
jgi:DNA repair protein RecN (Recombination protein N)